MWKEGIMKKLRSFLPVLSSVLFAILFYPIAAEAETCKDWLAKAVSVQGSVHVRVKSQTQWVPVKMNNTFCEGDMVRVQERSRAALVLKNETIIRLDQHTTITFPAEEKKKTSFIDIVNGILHFISRVPRTLTVSTPFVNGSVEGTEFLVSVYRDRSMFTVFEGQVTAANETGSITLMSGESAIAESGKAPSPYVVARPRDAVNWALYYPSVISWDSEDFTSTREYDWQRLVKKSMGYAAQGNLTEAFTIIEKIPDDTGDARFSTYRASLLLSVGRVDEALADIERSLQLAPGNGRSLALQSIIAVVQNYKDKALSLAQKAVGADPGSATAHIALSYALQSGFDLEGALLNVKEAVKVDPKNALAWARLAELRLSHRDLDSSLEAARKAVEYNPDLARTQSVLGFAHLAQINIKDAADSFEEAIKLDQAAPLPHLGLGLIKIRQGELEEGRREIEIAASLDPNNSLVRSYLGKAYYEEKRDSLSEGEYKLAQQLDPQDPTPFFYDAIRKQSINRPVEALYDLQKSIELNDNRAVYRSKLLLDEDLASRSASLARIYKDLGFQQLALVEGWRSVGTDPANYSSHRFLADLYSVLPRHEIGRVSELLQSQLLQPLNITPVQPSLGESDLFIFSGTGPGDFSFNEFNPAFNRDRITLQLSGVAGGKDTYGDEFVVAGIMENFSLSIGQFHYQSNGFRENNDQDQDIINVFAQRSLSHKTMLQTEFRFKDKQNGDLSLDFDPSSFLPLLREEDKSAYIRFGIRHDITPSSTIIGSFIYQHSDDKGGPAPMLQIENDHKGYNAELQHLFSSERYHLITGIGHYDKDLKTVTTTTIFMPPMPPISSSARDETSDRHTNLYGYSQINYPKTVTWTIGGSYDALDSENLDLDTDQFNPKVGLSWNLFSLTTFRAAAFRVLQRSLISKQTIEPTQVAGFNQFFEDEAVGTDAWNYGIAIDQIFSDRLFGGVEYSVRELDWSFISVSTPSPPPPGPGPPPGPPPAPVSTKVDTESEERLIRAYLYWAPHPWLSLSAEYQYERFEYDFEFGFNDVKVLKTHKLPLGVNVYLPSGFIARLKTTYVDQEGEFVSPTLTKSEDSDDFWVVDASLGYRLSKRRGIITIEAKNLFDENFKFQDTDPKNPNIVPEQLILLKFTLAL
jgi:tetratricopeptide (TPR) repeat protein